MSKRRKRKKRNEKKCRGHICLGGPVKDREIARLSCQYDAAADRKWFLDHPGESERTRPATLLEIAAFDLDPGTSVVVKRLSDGSQMRTFFFPQ